MLVYQNVTNAAEGKADVQFNNGSACVELKGDPTREKKKKTIDGFHSDAIKVFWIFIQRRLKMTLK